MIKIHSLLVCFTMFLNSLGLSPRQSPAKDSIIINAYDMVPTWTTGVIDGDRGSNLVISDLNQDGITEIVYCVNEHPLTLNYQDSGIYDIAWYGEDSRCKKIAAGDRDADGMYELYIGTSNFSDRTNSHVLIYAYDGTHYEMLNDLVLPLVYTIYDMVVGDADGDGNLEIVLVGMNSYSDDLDTLIYDANTLALEWIAENKGGRDVEIANIDTDPLPEIVVGYDNDNIPNINAHVLNASLKIEEWAVSNGGFGLDLATGDVDGDGMAEIAYVYNDDDLFVIDGDTRTIKWHLTDLGNMTNVAQGDLDNDGKTEVLINPGVNGSVSVHNGMTGELLGSLLSGEEALSIVVGDTNDDGINEIVWEAGRIIIANWQTRSVDWISKSIDGPFLVKAEDLENDGSVEIIVGSYSSAESTNNPGAITAFDGLSHQVEWSVVACGSTYFNLTFLEVAQLDTDSAREILVACEYSGNKYLLVYDGITHQLEWQSSLLNYISPVFAVVNLDEDEMEEIIIHVYSSTMGWQLKALDVPSETILWESEPLTGQISDIAAGDLNGDSFPEIAFITYDNLIVYDSSTWTQILNKMMTYAPPYSDDLVAIIPSNPKNKGKLITNTSYSATNRFNWLQIWDGSTFKLEFTQGFHDMILYDIVIADMDADGSLDINILGQKNLVSYPAYDYRNVLFIGSQSYPDFWKFGEVGRWRDFRSLAAADIDEDGENEIVLGSSTIIQVREVIKTPYSFEQLYIPAASRAIAIPGIYGRVTQNGVAASGVPLDLRFYDGSAWSTARSTTTNSDGMYVFLDVPTIFPGQYYYVLYQNPGDNPSRLWTWHTRAIGPYTSGDTVSIGSFDLATVALVSPPHGATGPIPVTFTWTPRPSSPTDSYEIDFYDSINYDLIWWSDPLGYVNHYPLNFLPTGIDVYDRVIWEVWMYSPDGGYGVSYDARWFTFTGSKSFPEYIPEDPRPKEIPEMPNPRVLPPGQ